ncbi:MAG: protease modulator HflK [Verrucomicrobiota bacterium]
MSEPHDTHDHAGHEHEPATPPAVEDAGSQALSEALRSSFVIVRWIMFALVIVFLGSGIFTVPPNQRAVVLRFGKPLAGAREQLIGPGLHWSLPPPIDEVVKIPISEIQNVTSSAGWYFQNPDGTDPGVAPSLNPAIDGYTMTSDGNIIHARVSVDYRITDPINYVLNFENAKEIVTNALDNALLDASAQFTVDNAVRLERGAFKEKVVQLFNRTVQQQQLGIVVESSRLDSKPPRQVNAAFDAVIAADLERSTTNNAARSAAATTLSVAMSESNSVVNTAITDSSKLLSRIRADSTNFLGRLSAYERNPALFRDILLTETWSRVIANADIKWLMPDAADGKPRELRLQLNNAFESEESRERRLKQKADPTPFKPTK